MLIAVRIAQCIYPSIIWKTGSYRQIGVSDNLIPWLIEYCTATVYFLTNHNYFPSPTKNVAAMHLIEMSFTSNFVYSAIRVFASRTLPWIFQHSLCQHYWHALFFTIIFLFYFCGLLRYIWGRYFFACRWRCCCFFISALNTNESVRMISRFVKQNSIKWNKTVFINGNAHS